MQYSENIRIDIFIAQQLIADKRQYCSFLCWVQCIKWRQQQPPRHLNSKHEKYLTLLKKQFTINPNLFIQTNSPTQTYVVMLMLTTHSHSFALAW